MSAERLRAAADRLEGGTLTLWYGRQVGGDSFDAAPLAVLLRHEADLADLIPNMDFESRQHADAVADAILGGSA